MLQQTQIVQAAPFFRRFMKRFPTLRSLSEASQQEVLKAWEGLGYYSRARNLHRTAQIIATEWKGRFPRTAADISSLPGIGPYTAAAIGSLAFDLDLAALDGNVIRVLSRLYAYGEDVRSMRAKRELQAMADRLLVYGQAGDFNEAMMELGGLICLPKKPHCPSCPLTAHCKGHAVGFATRFPVRKTKKNIPHLVVGTAVIINARSEMLVAQRRTDRMLGGLWEFPGGKQKENESIEACIARKLKEALGVIVNVGEPLVHVDHAYSHFTMEMHTFFADIQSGRPKALECRAFRWLSVGQLRELPFPKADLKVIEALEKHLKA